MTAESEKAAAQQVAAKAGEAAKEFEKVAAFKAGPAQSPSSWADDVHNVSSFEGYNKLALVTKSLVAEATKEAAVAKNAVRGDAAQP
jgi:hypothetical protein